MFDFIIKNGTVIDGSGNKEKLCDIGIQGEKVKEIGILPKDKAKKYIDAKGKIVCPGFIDIHSHSDFTVLADPNSESKVFQGITTEVNGNCGVSGAPLYGKALEKRLSTLKNLNLKLRWNTIDEYFDLIFTQKKTINFATFIGHGNVRGSVLGYENRKATKDETKDMERLLSESLKKDAWGFSSGLIYPPGIYAAKKELIALARVASNYGGIYASHIRSEGDEIIPAVKESIEIVKKAEVPLLISHLKILHKRNWEKISEVIGIIEKGRESGLIINADCYPYNASSTELDSLLPHWCYGGGDKELFFRLKDPSTSLKIERELNGLEDKEEIFWKNVLISGVHTEKNKYLTGRSLKSIADELNISPPKMLINLLIEEGLKVDAIFFFQNEAVFEKILSLDYVVIGSDSSSRPFSGILDKGKPHPRGFGTFPKILSRFVKEKKILSLKEAINKMTGVTANILGLKNRGFLKKGYFADIVVFSLEKIQDRATYNDPFKPPEGIEYVFVNGKPAVKKGKLTGNLPGKLLLKKI